MSVPRFTDEMLAPLKRVMLSCAPGFSLGPEHVQALAQETGLVKAQVQKWAENFRRRYVTEKERVDFLTTEGCEKDGSVKNARFFVTCFNVSPEFAANFKFEKSRGGGGFTVKYMLAAFDKEAGSGEFFMEFEDKVWEHKLVECFQSQGAGQVTTITFANNDGGESAANALVRVMTSQKKSGDGYTRGTCPPALYAKVHAKMEEAHSQEQLGAREFDEKTMAAIKQSLEQQQQVMVKVEGGLQSQAVELNGIKNGVQSQVVKLEGIENGVCQVIPDYQNEIRALKEALAKKTAACDTIEGKLAHKTRIINQQDAYIATLEVEKEIWSRTKMELQNRCTMLQEEFNMFRTLRQMIDTLSTTLAEERMAKRQRGD